MAELTTRTKQQKSVVKFAHFLQGYQVSKCSTSSGNCRVAQEQLKNSPEKKVLKVAIVGRPNAGKSTLVNGILKLTLCGVSSKTHTTKTPFQAAFIQGNTQVVFVDTPGLVTKKEYNRFGLSDDFVKWKAEVLDKVDLIGVIHEAKEPREIYKFHLQLVQTINELPMSKTIFLIVNKIDLILDRDSFSLTFNEYLKPRNLESSDSNKLPTVLQRFSKIFFTSALTNMGVDKVLEYLLEQAKPGQWLFEPGQVFNEPLHVVLRNLLRASLMNILPHEIPYLCEYQVEYMKENHLGEIICVCTIICTHERHLHLITSGRRGSLRSIAKELESDMYKLLGKVCRIRLVAKLQKT